MKKVFLTALFIILTCASCANAENFNCNNENMLATYRPYYTYNRNIYAKPKRCCAKTRSAYRYSHNRDIIKLRTENRKKKTSHTKKITHNDTIS